MATILVVDDELGIRALLSEILTDEGHTVELAENAREARAIRDALRLDLVLLDIWMPDVDGITLLKEWGAGGQLSMPVIMMSGHGTIDTAVEATRHGAVAFLEKPITLQKLLRAVEQALARNAAPRPAPGAPPPVGFVPPRSDVLLGNGGAGALAALGEHGYAGLGYGPPGALGELPGGHGGPVLAGVAGVAGVGGVGGVGAAAVLGGPQPVQSFELDRPLREARDAFEKSYFEFHLAREGGSMTRVAEKTGLERTHLYRKLKQLGVDLTRNKRGGVA